MSVAEKLAVLQRQGSFTPPPAREAPVALTVPGLRDSLPGRFTAVGARSFSVDVAYGGDAVHGRHALSHLRYVSGRHLSLVSKDPEVAYLDFEHAVFLDTETTGLSMGTGTYVFLVGAGWLEADGFHVRQFFLDGPDEEGAFLTALAEFLQGFSAVVSFNGKAFDWPMIEGRYHRYRRCPPLDDPAHLDLLHAARRLWKRRLESCALSSLEAHILGVHRTAADVPGWQIPSLWFQYQRTRDARLLEGVFYHNLHDVLSLATLTVHMDRVLAEPVGALVQEAIDLVCLGKVLEKAGEVDAALHCYEEALARGLGADERSECLSLLATALKRERRWHEALTIWELMADEGGNGALVALVEMAKFHEHVARDYSAAIDEVRQALILIELGAGTCPDVDLDGLQHRLARLLNRNSGRR